MRPDNERVSAPVRPYLRDCHDHAVQINDVIDTYREFALWFFYRRDWLGAARGDDE
jgi:hypothetical protein